MLGPTLLVVFALLGQTADAPPDPAALIEKLGAASFAEREASKSLENLGGKALPALRGALKSRDAEVRARARAMIDRIEARLLVQETPIRLDFKDAPLDDVLKSISNQAGFQVSLAGRGPMNMGSRTERITLSDPAPTGFWKAVDRVFEAARLGYQAQPGAQVRMMRSAARPQSDLVFAPQAEFSSPPSSDHGPFRVSLMMLSYASQVRFNVAPVPGRPRPASGALPPNAAKKAAARPAPRPLALAPAIPIRRKSRKKRGSSPPGPCSSSFR